MQPVMIRFPAPFTYPSSYPASIAASILVELGRDLPHFRELILRWRRLDEADRRHGGKDRGRKRRQDLKLRTSSPFVIEGSMELIGSASLKGREVAESRGSPGPRALS